MFLPPDEDNDYENHGIENLVVKYNQHIGGSSFLVLDEDIHLQSQFCKDHKLEEHLKRFIDEFNDVVQPQREQMNSLDRLSLLFLSISFLGAAVGAYVLFQFYEIIHALLFMLAYFPVSVFVLKMISWQIDDL